MSKTKAKRYWLALMKELGVDELIWRPFFVELEKLYREKHRAYHRLKHIGQFLDHLYKFSASPSVAMRLAVFFHDAVYNPKSKTNEFDSWLMAKSFIAAACTAGSKQNEQAILSAVEMLIMATASHTEKRIVDSPALSQEELDLFLDCDLLILAAERRAYDRYCRQIRFEYSHISDIDFRAGRGAFLTKFIKEPVLFRTPAISSFADRKARANMARELLRC